MLRSIFLKTLRGYWVAILGWGSGLSLMVYAVLSVYASQYATPQARQEFAVIAQTFRFFGDPIAMNTATGFVTWRSLGIIPVLLGIWGVLAGSRLVRGAEERRYLEVVLGQPVSRTRYLLEGVAALTVAVGVIGLLVSLAAYAGAQQAKESVDLMHALLTGFAISFIVHFFAMLALLLSQLVRYAGAAAGIAGALMVLAYTVDGLGRVVKGGGWISNLSPYHLYTINKSLIVNYDGARPLALLALVALSLVCLGSSIVLFQRRDLNGVLFGGWQRATPAEAPGTVLAHSDRQAVLRGITPLALLETLPGIGWWALGLATYTIFFVGITRATKDQLIDILSQSPGLGALFSAISDGTDTAFIGGLLFFFLPIALTLFALLVAAHWTRTLEAGYFELVLGTPTSRQRVFVDSLKATLLALPLLPLLLLVLTVLCCKFWGLTVPTERLAVAFLGLLVLELLVAGVVYCLTGWLGANTLVGLVGGVLVASFLVQMLGPILNWPKSVQGLSIFYQYGTPVIGDPRWLAWGVMALLAIVLAGIGYTHFLRMDLERGS